MPKLAARSDVPPFLVMDVLRAATARERAGGNVLHLEAGQPSTPAPRRVREAAAHALQADKLGYTDALGLPSLRARIAAWYGTTYGVDLAPERIAVTTGSSAGFLLAFLAAFDPGDRVALATPGYPAYRHILRALGVEPVELPVGPADRFQPTPERLDSLGHLDGLIVASPSNPTGTMVDAAQLGALAAWCRARDVRLVSDEIYHGITYDRTATTAVAFDDEAIVAQSFSKFFSMTGWRIGWLVLPAAMVRRVECLAQNLYISPPTLAQVAAEAAFDAQDELQAHVARYAMNRQILLDGLARLGLAPLAPPDGAFYLYVDVGHLTDDSVAWCQRLLHDTGLALTPGVDFDDDRGRHTVRLSFAGTPEQMHEAGARLGRWLGP